MCVPAGCQNLTHSPCPRLLSRVVPRTRCKLKLGCHLAPLPVERVQHKRTRLLAELRRQMSIERRLNARARDRCQSQIQTEAQSQCFSHGSASLPRHSVSPIASIPQHSKRAMARVRIPPRLGDSAQLLRSTTSRGLILLCRATPELGLGGSTSTTTHCLHPRPSLFFFTHTPQSASASTASKNALGRGGPHARSASRGAQSV